MNFFKKMWQGFFAHPHPLFVDWGTGLSQSGEIVNDTSVLSLSTVWRCVSLLAGTVASLPVMVYRRDGQDVPTPHTEHALYKILHDAPNYDQTAFDFWHFMTCAIEMRGNAYARITRNGMGQIIALTPLNPACVTVTRQEDGGLSPLTVGRNVFGTALSADKTAGDMFRNGLRPTGVLTFQNWLNNEQRAVVKETLAAKIGTGNGGKPLVLEGGTGWQQLALSPEDAQMLQSRAFSVEEICRLFGVPPHMVGHTEKATSWGSGLEQQTLAFLQFTLRERLKRIEQAINKQLLSRAERGKGIYASFNIESLLRADSHGRAEYYQTMTMIGAMTINEVRRLEHLPPVTGGDVARVQMQNVPIDQIDGVG